MDCRLTQQLTEIIWIKSSKENIVCKFLIVLHNARLGFIDSDD